MSSVKKLTKKINKFDKNFARLQRGRNFKPAQEKRAGETADTEYRKGGSKP